MFGESLQVENASCFRHDISTANFNLTKKLNLLLYAIFKN